MRGRKPRSVQVEQSDLFLEDAWRILQKCNAPKHWSLIEAWVLLLVVMLPEQLKVGERVKNGFVFKGTVGPEERRAMIFAALVAEAPYTVITAWPRLVRMINTKMKSPEFCAALQMRWDISAEQLARQWRDGFRKNIGAIVTPKVIHHARERCSKAEAFARNFPLTP